MKKIKLFVQDYLNLLFEINKQLWLQQYLSQNIMDNDQQDEEIDFVAWAKNHLSFQSAWKNLVTQRSIWDNILQAFIRAYSANLIKRHDDAYLRLANGVEIDKKYWSNRVDIEKTFANNTSEFNIYCQSDSRADGVYISYLVPVQLSWVLKLNPIYYFYFLYDRSTMIYRMPADDNILRVRKIIKNMRASFNYNDLVSYLDRLGNKKVSQLVKRDVVQYYN